jgi:hypothetical protein
VTHHKWRGSIDYRANRQFGLHWKADVAHQIQIQRRRESVSDFGCNREAFDYCVRYSAWTDCDGFEVVAVEVACRGIDVEGTIAARAAVKPHWGLRQSRSPTLAAVRPIELISIHRQLAKARRIAWH